MVGTRPPGSVKQSPFEMRSLFHTDERKKCTVYAIHVRNRPYSGAYCACLSTRKDGDLNYHKGNLPLLERLFDDSIDSQTLSTMRALLEGFWAVRQMHKPRIQNAGHAELARDDGEIQKQSDRGKGLVKMIIFEPVTPHDWPRYCVGLADAIHVRVSHQR